MTRRSTSCGGSCSRRARRSCTSATTGRSTRWPPPPIAEDVQGVAISAYQGGHVEYFSYLVELLRERGAGHIKVFGGGGGVIVREEIELLHSRGVARIFSPEDGYEMGLPGMINMMIKACDVDLAAEAPALDKVLSGDVAALSRVITQLQAEQLPGDLLSRHHRGRGHSGRCRCSASPAPAARASRRSPTS